MSSSEPVPPPTTALCSDRKILLSQLYRITGGIVQTGPFIGMRMCSRFWGEEAGPKLLGCYEQELHPYLTPRHSLVINVGTAEGYYAVGFARLGLGVVGFESSAEVRGVCEENAKLNGVGLDLRGECIALPDEFAFILCDCEGAERTLMQPTAFLAGSDFIIECHDFIDPTITNTLVERFIRTHDLTRVTEGARDPNYPCLRKLVSNDRWLMISENRPCTMHWLIGRSKDFGS